MSSCEAPGRLQLLSLLHARCRGGDAGADHLCPLGQAGWGWQLLVKAGRRCLPAVGEAGVLGLLGTINRSRFWWK